MERQTRQSADIPKWSALLVEAVNKPGLIMKAYSNFHSYSLGNQLLALVQCQMRGLQPGPINTFPKWRELGRHVKRGERALMLCMPITCKQRDETTDEGADGEHTFTSFAYKARWFVLTQTEGEDLQPQIIPEWDAKRALAALAIDQISFDSTDGNCQGFARLCCRQHKRAYVAKLVVWLSAFLPTLSSKPANRTPHKFKAQSARRNVI
jgi:hypothetical protein